MAGGSVTRNYDYFKASRGLVEFVSMPTIIDEFLSAPRKPVQQVLSVKKREMKKFMQHGHQERRGRGKRVIVTVGHNAKIGKMRV